MSDDVQTSATIASLRAEVERLTDYNQRMLAENVRMSNEVCAIGTRASMDADDHAATRKELDAVVILLDGHRVLRKEAEARAESLSHSIMAACTGSGCLNAHELRQALDTARERAGVLAAEVRAYREWQRTKCDDNTSSLDHWHACKALDAATLETDRTNALDAAKCGGGQ